MDGSFGGRPFFAIGANRQKGLEMGPDCGLGADLAKEPPESKTPPRSKPLQGLALSNGRYWIRTSDLLLVRQAL
jgi:hypothetical protein